MQSVLFFWQLRKVFPENIVYMYVEVVVGATAWLSLIDSQKQFRVLTGSDVIVVNIILSSLAVEVRKLQVVN